MKRKSECKSKGISWLRKMSNNILKGGASTMKYNATLNRQWLSSIMVIASIIALTTFNACGSTPKKPKAAETELEEMRKRLEKLEQGKEKPEKPKPIETRIEELEERLDKLEQVER
jgi:hypothetical protein